VTPTFPFKGSAAAPMANGCTPGVNDASGTLGGVAFGRPFLEGDFRTMPEDLFLSFGQVEDTYSVLLSRSMGSIENMDETFSTPTQPGAEFTFDSQFVIGTVVYRADVGTVQVQTGPVTDDQLSGTMHIMGTLKNVKDDADTKSVDVVICFYVPRYSAW